MYKYPATWNCGRNARENCAVESRTVVLAERLGVSKKSHFREHPKWLPAC
jgi:hypothetical protein